MEEIESKKPQLRKAVNQWKKDHPDWDKSDPMKVIESKVEAALERANMLIGKY